MKENRYPIPGKEANPFDSAVTDLINKLVELAGVSPTAFAYAVHSYVVHVCVLMHSMQDIDACFSPSSYFKDTSNMIRSHTQDIEDRFVTESKLVADKYGIKADTFEFGDDNCGF